MPSFLGRKLRGAFGQQAFLLGNRMTIVFLPLQYRLCHNFAGNLVIYSIFLHDIFDKMQQFQTAIDSLRKVSVSHVYFLPNTIEYVLSAFEDNRYSKMELSLFSLFVAPTLCNWSVFVRQYQGTTEALNNYGEGLVLLYRNFLLKKQVVAWD